MSARSTALGALIACRRQGAWSDGILKEYIARDRLDERDAALATRLCYGVIQNRLLLDYYIDYFLTVPRKKLQPITEDILRLGIFQLVLMERIPASAAVNESVKLAKKYVNQGAAGLVNGLLRAVTRTPEMPIPESLGVRYSHPQDLVLLLAGELPEEELEQALAANNQTPGTIVHNNPLKISEGEALRKLREMGAEVTPGDWDGAGFSVIGAGSPEKWELFREGAVYIQDDAALLAAMACGVRPGMRIMDCCAAPGGKSFAIAMAAGNDAEIISCDIHPHKLKLIEAGASRLGLTCIHPKLQDASVHIQEWENSFDAVIADVPCSGLGVIRKKPEVRYKDLNEIQHLPELQLRILLNQAQYVRPGGILLYSTCTVLNRENGAVVRSFLEKHPEFSLESLPLPQKLCAKNDGMVTLWPHRQNTDGFFICRMRRTV